MEEPEYRAGDLPIGCYQALEYDNPAPLRPKPFKFGFQRPLPHKKRRKSTKKGQKP